VEQKVFDARVEKLAANYPPDKRAAALIPVLHAAQKLRGWLSPQTLAYVAGVVGVPPTRVQEVATFYSMFRLKPAGRHHVAVCGNLSCWLAGADKLHEHLQKRLGTRPFEPTADGLFSHAEVECLASCGTAPAVLVDERYYEGLSVEKLDAILDKLASEPAAAQPA